MVEKVDEENHLFCDLDEAIRIGSAFISQPYLHAVRDKVANQDLHRHISRRLFPGQTRALRQILFQLLATDDIESVGDYVKLIGKGSASEYRS